MKTEIVSYGGWKNNVRLSNAQVELVITLDIGPRIIRYGFINGENVFAEIGGQMGKSEEPNWQIRGGHRLWLAPEHLGLSSEPDNTKIQWEEIDGGIRTIQDTGSQTGIQKKMEIRLLDDNSVVVNHILENKSCKEVEYSAWALTCMNVRGELIVPMPAKKTFGQKDTAVPNQTLSVWQYTDLSDPRFCIGARYYRIKQNPESGYPFKIGLANKEGWVAYWVNRNLFVKYFDYIPGMNYPDGNVNFEVFNGTGTMEVESLGPVVKMQPGERVEHLEKWKIFGNIPAPRREEEIDWYIATKI